MKTVLVIDDDRVFRTLLTQSLTAAGWQVVEAGDGESGLELALQHRPDVVLCDLLMPRGNGFQFCRALREQQATIGRPRIIVTTGSSYPTDRQNAMAAGADDYLVKPIRTAELLERLGRVEAATVAASPSQPPPSSASQAGPPAARLKFWGVRGSIPSPGSGTVRFGGNTACVEVRSHGQIVILDAGSGIRPLGLALLKEAKGEPIRLTVLVSHTHWDHIQGFPFFVPAYNPKNQIQVLGYEGARRGLEAALAGQMESPYFPISMQQMPGNIAIQELRDLTFSVGEVRVQATFLNHPGICTGYRLLTSGGAIAYLPDLEPYSRSVARPGGTPDPAALEFAQGQDQRLIEFIGGADILIIDSQYTTQEYESRIGWGHSCVDDSVALAVKANVKRLFLFHHDPDHDDATIASMEAGARALAARLGGTLSVQAAREGVEVVLEPAKPD